MKFYVQTPTGKNKMVGELGVDGIFRKVVSHRTHYFLSAGAYGIDEEVVKQLFKMKCREIRLLEDEKLVWSSPFEAFMEKSWLHTYGGFKDQRFLAKDRWNIRDFTGRYIQTAKDDKINPEIF